MRKKENITLGDIYGDILKGVQTIEEKNCGCPIKLKDNAFTDDNPLQSGGPSEQGGYHKALNDEDEMIQNGDEDMSVEEHIEMLKRKLADKTLAPEIRFQINKQIEQLSKKPETAVVRESKKIARRRLNTFMTKKSTFDKLFESVMNENWMGGDQDEQSDIPALGLDDAPTDDEVDMESGEGDDDKFTVTVGGIDMTLDRATAQQLHDDLMTALGESEDEMDFEDESEEYDDEDEPEDEDEEYFDEDEETIGDHDTKLNSAQAKLTGKSNKVNGRPQPKGGTASSDVTDKVGNNGDHGHAIYNAKKPNDGRNNKVSNLRQAEDFFR